MARIRPERLGAGDEKVPEMVEKMGHEVETVSDRIATFIEEDLKWEGPRESLVGPHPVELASALDSTDLMELAGYVENTFGIEIADEGIVVENFSSVRRVAELVVEKLIGTGSL